MRSITCHVCGYTCNSSISGFILIGKCSNPRFCLLCVEKPKKRLDFDIAPFVNSARRNTYIQKCLHLPNGLQRSSLQLRRKCFSPLKELITFHNIIDDPPIQHLFRRILTTEKEDLLRTVHTDFLDQSLRSASAGI